MPEKKYLIVSRCFYPDNSPRANRTTELAKELSRQGHRVSVLTTHHPKQESLSLEFNIRMIELGRDWCPEIPINFFGRSNIVLRAARRALSITLSYPTVELAFRIPKALKKVEHHHVLISIAAPHSVHWGVARAFSSRRKPADVWLADCGDPFMGQENDSFKPAPYFKYVEKAFCRRADAVVVPVEGAREAYYSEFRDKVHVIPQGFCFDDYVHLKDIHPKNDGVVRFAYAGLFIPGRRDPTKFLKELVKRSDDFEFHVFTKNPVLVEPYARQDSRIIVRDFTPRDQLMKELASMDFLLNIENVGARQSPSKLIDYWLCNRPVLNIKSNEVNAEVVDQFLSGDCINALKIENPERYDIVNVVEQFDQLAEKTLASKKVV